MIPYNIITVCIIFVFFHFFLFLIFFVLLCISCKIIFISFSPFLEYLSVWCQCFALKPSCVLLLYNISAVAWHRFIYFVHWFTFLSFLIFASYLFLQQLRHLILVLKLHIVVRRRSIIVGVHFVSFFRSLFPLFAFSSM